MTAASSQMTHTAKQGLPRKGRFMIGRSLAGIVTEETADGATEFRSVNEQSVLASGREAEGRIRPDSVGVFEQWA